MSLLINNLSKICFFKYYIKFPLRCIQLVMIIWNQNTFVILQDVMPYYNFKCLEGIQIYYCSITLLRYIKWYSCTYITVQIPFTRWQYVRTYINCRDRISAHFYLWWDLVLSRLCHGRWRARDFLIIIDYIDKEGEKNI